MLAAALEVFSWFYLLVGVVALSYGIYGRVTIRPDYGPLNVLDFFIPLFCLIVVAAGFWGLRKLAKNYKKNPVP